MLNDYSKFIKTLRGAGLNPSATEIADALWLAEHLPSHTPDIPLPEDEDKQDPGQPTPPTPSPDTPPTPSPPETPKPPPQSEHEHPMHQQPHADIYHQSGERRTRAAMPRGAALPIKSPAATALPGRLDISRALRPFMRRVPSPTMAIFDEDATTYWISETRLWFPQERPQQVRWLDVALVVDVGTSMAIWRRTLHELKHVLHTMGAFRNVYPWSLVTDAEDDALHMYAGLYTAHLPTARKRNPRELIDPSGQRLILIVSDCVSPGWYSGAVAQLLGEWGRHNLVSIVQVLPQRLWPRSVLGTVPETYLRPPFPGAPNTMLIQHQDEDDEDDEFDDDEDELDVAQASSLSPDTAVAQASSLSRTISIPLVTLEPEALTVWARALAGSGETWTYGVVFTIPSPPPVETLHATSPAASPAASPQMPDTEEPESQPVPLFKRFWQGLQRLVHKEKSESPPPVATSPATSPATFPEPPVETLRATSPPQPPFPDPDVAVKTFRRYASPTARKLASLMAAAPLTVPVMHMVQRTKLPQSRQVHLAEVFLGGLLWQPETNGQATDPDDVLYDFYPGVRDRLLDGVPLDQAFRIFQETMTAFVERRMGQPLDFLALLVDPTALGTLEINEHNRPFAIVAASVLRKLGGEYTTLAKRLEQGSPPPPDPAQTLLAQERWEEAIAHLEPRADSGDETAIHMLATLPGTAAVPVELRIRTAHILGKVGDPRPGVCTLPPVMAHVEGGTFVIGTKKEEKERLEKQGFKYLNREINDQPVTVYTFELARYPVTNAQYKLFMDDDGYNPDKPWWDDAGRAWLKDEKKRQPKYWNDKRFGIAHPNQPVVGVTWYEAMAFCRWLTQHTAYNPEGYIYTLPSEAEWEYAARGTQRRLYPWGNEPPDGERTNFNQTHNGTTPVGCFPLGATPKSAWLLDDMAGNVWEWTCSVYKPYPYDASDGREDLTNPSEQRFCLRGGGWYYRSVFLRASDRLLNTPDVCVNSRGFRLARHLP